MLKKSDKEDYLNPFIYRLIALLNILEKILEVMIFN